MKWLKRFKNWLFIDKIRFTITQADYDLSGEYGDIRNCLVATALRRLGYKDVSVGGGFALINGRFYYGSGLTCRDLGGRCFHDDEPKYDPAVVGRKFVLSRS